LTFSVPHFSVGSIFNRKMWDRKIGENIVYGLLIVIR